MIKRAYASIADAGLVPCADIGMKQTLRWPYPILSKYPRMVIIPVYSPAAPLLGCKENPSSFVIAFNQSLILFIIVLYP